MNLAFHHAYKLYTAYGTWEKDNGYRQTNIKNFVADLRRRLDIRRGNVGNVVVGLMLDTLLRSPKSL